MDPKVEPIHYLNMRLDYFDGESVFYDEFTFERDSLFTLAFDDNGKTKNQEEYAKILALPRPRLDDLTFIDYINGAITQIHRHGTITIRGKEELELPSWELLNDTRKIGSYNCKKAVSRFMGREWIIWYTEDVPLPIGPWMLFGAPGLIVYAEDSESYFSFKLVWNDSLDTDERMSFLDSRFPGSSYRKGAKAHFVIPFKEAEIMNNRLKTDAAYMFEIIGARSKDIDKLQQKMKYIPLIPVEYWKDK